MFYGYWYGVDIVVFFTNILKTYNMMNRSLQYELKEFLRSRICPQTPGNKVSWQQVFITRRLHTSTIQPWEAWPGRSPCR